MTRYATQTLLWFVLMLVVAPQVTAAEAAPLVVASPGGDVSAIIDVDAGGRLVIAVERRGVRVLEPSPVGVVVYGDDLGVGVRLGPAKTKVIDNRYAWNGHAAELRDHGVEARIPVRRPGREWVLEVRAYDDGVAWRCVIPGGGQRKVTGEPTAFHLPSGASFWSHRNTKSYEGIYERFDAANLDSDRSYTMPLTIELPGGGFACLAEADVMHYSGMTLQAAGEGRLKAAFEDDADGWTMRGAFATPWRVCIAVDDLGGLVNSSIIYNVSPAPDPALFPQGAETPWIKPGRALWQWWWYGWDGMDWDKQPGFVDMAAAIGCDYYLVDEGWESEKRGWIADGRTKWDSLRQLVRYAKSKDVEIWVWRHWNQLQDAEQRERFFRQLSDAGAVGVKIDFMESESQERLAFYREALESAARHRIMVNFHGANKSAGENRTWPHEMTREGIFGLEQNKGGPRIPPHHYAALPFTTFIGGAKDFTPTTFKWRHSHTSSAFQLATAVIYTSPFLCWADQAEEYLKSPAIDLIRVVPATWDRTTVLPGSRIGEFVAFARQKDGRWWVAILNATEEAQTYELDLAFLGDGQWRAQAANDVAGEPERLQMQAVDVAAGATLAIPLEAKGGYVARFERVGDE